MKPEESIYLIEVTDAKDNTYYFKGRDGKGVRAYDNLRAVSRAISQMYRWNKDIVSSRIVEVTEVWEREPHEAFYYSARGN